MTKEALKLALEALEHEANIGNDDAYKLEREAIKEALAQPEQGQFALKHRIAELEGAVIGLQAQRTWVGLTNDELTDLFYNENLGQECAVSQAIALLKERNT